jgi:hypothetical protein
VPAVAAASNVSFAFEPVMIDDGWNTARTPPGTPDAVSVTVVGPPALVMVVAALRPAATDTELGDAPRVKSPGSGVPPPVTVRVNSAVAVVLPRADTVTR